MSTGLILATCLAVIVAAVVVAVWLRRELLAWRAASGWHGVREGLLAPLEAEAVRLRAESDALEAKIAALTADQPASDHGDHETAARPGDEGR